MEYDFGINVESIGKYHFPFQTFQENSCLLKLEGKKL